MDKGLFGGIEAGGTKFICAVGNVSGQILARTRIPTTSPEQTLSQVVDFFKPYLAAGEVDRIGLACFGPLDLDPTSPFYGHITNTPKLGWANTDILGILKSSLGVRMAFDMDVNGSAIGEHTWGASKNIDPSLYITIGTGIGGGYLVNGQPLKGMVNLEIGHIRLPRKQGKDPFPGNCPFHGDCFEGLASGPALQARLGMPADDLPEDHPVWELEIEYISRAVADLVVVLSPRIIILGGGIMRREYLFKEIRTKVQELLNGYVRHRSILESIDDYIVPPKLGGDSGVLGAIAMAINLKTEQN